MIYTANAFARAGMVGNPSDGYFGKTLSFVIRNFKATVRLWESPHFEIVPGQRRSDQVPTPSRPSSAMFACMAITAACA